MWTWACGPRLVDLGWGVTLGDRGVGGHIGGQEGLGGNGRGGPPVCVGCAPHGGMWVHPSSGGKGWEWGAYSALFHPILSKSTLFQNIPPNSDLFQSIPPYPTLLQPILYYSTLCWPIPPYSAPARMLTTMDVNRVKIAMGTLGKTTRIE